MNQTVRPLLVIFGILTVLTGVAYPLAVTLIGHLFFARQASGSLIAPAGKIIGSSLIGQPFSDPKYFWGRVSATSPMPNNASGSTGSNLGATNPGLPEAGEGRLSKLKG